MNNELTIFLEILVECFLVHINTRSFRELQVTPIILNFDHWMTNKWLGLHYPKSLVKRR